MASAQQKLRSSCRRRRSRLAGIPGPGDGRHHEADCMKSVVSGALLALLLPAVMVGCDRGGAAASMPSSSAATAAPASVAPAAASAAGTSARADASA
ncbi:hypothetical protein, partial [Thermomonas sp.]|uniref:hypothetical protein n=1 Tax=Thermomonas sp. TaxID=1971895 RepID=UPI002619103A